MASHSVFVLYLESKVKAVPFHSSRVSHYVLTNLSVNRPLQPPSQRSEPLPTVFELPSEDPEETGLPDEFHDF